MKRGLSVHGEKSVRDASKDGHVRYYLSHNLITEHAIHPTAVHRIGAAGTRQSVIPSVLLLLSEPCVILTDT